MSDDFFFATTRHKSNTYLNPDTGNMVLTRCNQIVFGGLVLANVWTDRLTTADIPIEIT